MTIKGLNAHIINLFFALFILDKGHFIGTRAVLNRERTLDPDLQKQTAELEKKVQGRNCWFICCKWHVNAVL